MPPLWQRCPRRHYYRYTLGLPEDLAANPPLDQRQGQWEADEPDPRRAGIAVHAAIARWKGASSERDLARIVREELQAALAPDPLRDADIQTTTNAIARFFKTDLWTRIASSQRQGWEVPIDLRHAGMNVRGTIDLFAVSEDSLVVVDFKTSPVSAKEAHRRAHDYRLQLGVYLKALCALHPVPRAQALCAFLVPGETVPIEHDALDVHAVLTAFLSAQIEATHHPAPGPHCPSCPYHPLCPDANSNSDFGV